jgi:hypothetical protein
MTCMHTALYKLDDTIEIEFICMGHNTDYVRLMYEKETRLEGVSVPHTQDRY